MWVVGVVGGISLKSMLKNQKINGVTVKDIDQINKTDLTLKYENHEISLLIEKQYEKNIYNNILK